MLVELNGKAGRICEYARRGILRCPMIVRPTSEDQITGEMFQVLRAINPRYWLPQLLNRALGAGRFRQQVFRQLKLDLWVNQPRFPQDLLPWAEGSTQVDAAITWENSPTTIFVEMKYLAGLSPSTTNGRRQSEFPSDQLIRNIRIGLWRTGWLEEPMLFSPKPRDFAVIVISPFGGTELVQLYRDPDRLVASIPCSDKLKGLPKLDFIGELNYSDIVMTIRQTREWVTRPERLLIDDLCSYLEFKLHQATVSGKAGGYLSRRPAEPLPHTQLP